MDPQTFMDMATVVTKLKMFPYFDIAHMMLCCMAVRDDIVPQAQAAGAQVMTFQRKHPLSSWMSSMLVCFAGSILANLLLGEPVIIPFKDQRALLTATMVWCITGLLPALLCLTEGSQSTSKYLVNYCPFDLVYKMARFLPFKLLLCMLKEVQRAHKVYHGVVHTAKLYPTAYFVIVLIGTVKGNGSIIIRNFERLVRGIWAPGSSEVLQPTFMTKACVVASIIFLCERLNYIAVPHVFIYFGVVIFFVYFKLSSILLGIVDPFVPLENLFCAVFMGGMWEAMRRAVKPEPVKEEDSKDGILRSNDVIKSKEEKKKD